VAIYQIQIDGRPVMENGISCAVVLFEGDGMLNLNHCKMYSFGHISASLIN